ncbi:MAG: hypothetical protein ABL925_21625 [Methylococcales bacterium]
MVIYLLIFQGVLGGIDVIWNHEWKEKLPTKLTASLEQQIHGIRELFYSVIFIGLAWLEWKGIWAWVLFSVIVIEIIFTAWDFIIEDKTRVLSATERITHLLLSMSGGAYVVLLMPILLNWSILPSGFISVEYEFHSWILTIFGMGALAWGIRDISSGLVSSRYAKESL